MKFLMDRYKYFRFILVTVFSLVFLAACGGGGGSSADGSSVSDNSVAASQSESSYTGSNSVGDQSPPSPPEDGSGDAGNGIPLPELGEITLSWVAPSTRADGSPLSLSEITNYRIYYTTESGKYSKFVSVSGSSSTVTIDGLPLGRYYLAMTTVDADGLESGFSPEISVII